MERPWAILVSLIRSAVGVAVPECWWEDPGSISAGFGFTSNHIDSHRIFDVILKIRCEIDVKKNPYNTFFDLLSVSGG